MVLSCEGNHMLTYFMKSDYFNYRILKTPHIESADTHMTATSEIIRRAVWTITGPKTWNRSYMKCQECIEDGPYLQHALPSNKVALHN